MKKTGFVNPGYPVHMFEKMVATAREFKVPFHVGRALWYNPDVQPFILKHYKKFKTLPESITVESPDLYKPKKIERVRNISLSCSLKDKTQPKHDLGSWINRVASQCQFCGCWLENVIDDEVKDVMEKAGIECSHERVMYDPPQSERPCVCFYRSKAACIFCGKENRVENFALVEKPEDLSNEVPANEFPCYVCPSCIS